jgi:hypothetical protein
MGIVGIVHRPMGARRPRPRGSGPRATGHSPPAPGANKGCAICPPLGPWGSLDGLFGRGSPVLTRGSDRTERHGCWWHLSPETGSAFSHHPRRGLCSPLLPRRSQRHTQFRCLLICSSYAPLQSASDHRGLCLLSCEGFECTDVLFCPIPPLHRLLCHLCSPFKPAGSTDVPNAIKRAQVRVAHSNQSTTMLA